MKKDLNKLSLRGKREDREVLKMTFILFISYIICTIPIATVNIIDPSKKKIRLQSIMQVIFTGQAIINPFVYAFKNKTYKPAFVKLYQQICCFCLQIGTSINTETGETRLSLGHKPHISPNPRPPSAVVATVPGDLFPTSPK